MENILVITWLNVIIFHKFGDILLIISLFINFDWENSSNSSVLALRDISYMFKNK